mmetsp:Transcript_33788/g.100610  ORF Transcript_33788/g.100610 Transcript_33788/m.100610 type:complete len:257 (+) Transcript_33788:1426-2196(+)
MQQQEGVVPLVVLDVEADERLGVVHLEQRLLGVRVLRRTTKVSRTHAEAARVALVERAHHVDELVIPLVAREDGNRAVVLLGFDVHLGRRVVVLDLLTPLRLLVDELLHLARLAARLGVLLRPLFGLIKLAQVAEHLHGLVHTSGLRVEARRVLVAPHVGHDLRHEQALWQALLLASFRLVHELNVPHVTDADESLPRNLQVHRLQRLQRQLPPVGLGDAKARDAVRAVEVLGQALEVAVHGRRLRHVDRLHADIV